MGRNPGATGVTGATGVGVTGSTGVTGASGVTGATGVGLSGIVPFDPTVAPTYPAGQVVTFNGIRILQMCIANRNARDFTGLHIASGQEQQV